MAQSGAQMLVMLVDKTNADPVADSKCYKAGDVVSIRSSTDNAFENDPGIKERLGSFWIVVEIANANENSLTAFTAVEPGDPVLKSKLQRRGARLDIAGVIARLDPNDQNPAKPHVKYLKNLGQIMACKVTKPPLNGGGK